MHINGFQGDCDVENCPFTNEKQDIPDFLEKTTEPTSLPPRRPNSAVLEGRYIFQYESKGIILSKGHLILNIW